MSAHFGSLSVLPWIVCAQMSWDLSAVPILTTPAPSYEVPPEVDDRAGVFSNDVKRGARQTLRQMRNTHRVLILVETAGSLGGQPIDAVALRRARPLGAHGIYILVSAAGRDRDVAVVLGKGEAHGLLSAPDRAAVREAFLGPLRVGDADGGLERGLRTLRTKLADAAASRPTAAYREAILPLTILFVLLAVLVAIRLGAGDQGTRKRRRLFSSYDPARLRHRMT